MDHASYHKPTNSTTAQVHVTAESEIIIITVRTAVMPQIPAESSGDVLLCLCLFNDAPSPVFSPRASERDCVVEKLMIQSAAFCSFEESLRVSKVDKHSITVTSQIHGESLFPPVNTNLQGAFVSATLHAFISTGKQKKGNRLERTPR